MVSEEAECGELLRRQRALLGAEAICSQEFPPAEYVSFLPEWKQCKGRESRGKKLQAAGANGAKTRLDRFRLLGSQSRDCVLTLRSLSGVIPCRVTQI